MFFIPVILITDALVFLLLLFVIGFVWYAARYPHLRAPWQRVITSQVGVATLVILISYIIIGLLDTIHLRLRLKDSSITSSVIETSSGSNPQYAPEILSVLDLLLDDLRHGQEKTYSAPLATHLLMKESIIQADGQTIHVYPRLVYGGRHLDNPTTQWGSDLALRSVTGVFKGLIWWGFFVFILIWSLARRYVATMDDTWQAIRTGSTPVPWRVVLIIVAILFICVGIGYELAAEYHILGTDKVGEDVFYQTLKSIRTGLLIGTLTTLVMLPAALFLGVTAGYFGGWVDDVIQYLYTTLNSIPGVLLIAAAVLLLQVYLGNHADAFPSSVERADLRLLCLCLILGVTSWTGLCRLLRGEALKLREVEYVQAAIALGVGQFKILTRHLLPNLFHIVLITIVLDFSGLVLAEAVLSYINIGVDPTMNSWGNMINAARLELARDPPVWWSLAAAFGPMFLLVLAANLFADVVRDAFDPRSMGRV